MKHCWITFVMRTPQTEQNQEFNQFLLITRDVFINYINCWVLCSYNAARTTVYIIIQFHSDPKAEAASCSTKLHNAAMNSVIRMISSECTISSYENSAYVVSITRDKG